MSDASLPLPMSVGRWQRAVYRLHDRIVGAYREARAADPSGAYFVRVELDEREPIVEAVSWSAPDVDAAGVRESFPEWDFDAQAPDEAINAIAVYHNQGATFAVPIGPAPEIDDEPYPGTGAHMLESLYWESRAYHILLDLTGAGWPVSLEMLQAAAGADCETMEGQGDEPIPSPEDWLRETGREAERVETSLSGLAGAVHFVEIGDALAYLVDCLTVGRVLMTLLASDAIRANPGRAAREAGPLGALFAQIEMMEQGMDVEEARVALVVDAMEHADTLPEGEQAEAVKRARANVMAIRPVLVEPGGARPGRGRVSDTPMPRRIDPGGEQRFNPSVDSWEWTRNAIDAESDRF